MRKRRKSKMLQPVEWALQAPWRTGNLRMEKKRKVRYATYYSQKEISSVRHWLVFVNGRNEYIEKYGYFPSDLNLPQDWGFLTWDHRGQGDSSGQRGHVVSFGDYAADAQAVVETVLGRTVSYDVISHSMGALIALTSILKGGMTPGKLALISPFLGVPRGALPLSISRGLAASMHRLRLGRVYVNGSGMMANLDFATNDKTYNRERYLQQALSPYRSSQITFAWLHAAFEALKVVQEPRALRRLKNIQCLVLQASEETVVDLAAIDAWSQAAREQGVEVTSHIFSPAKHELLSEKEAIYEQVITLLKGHLGG
ncbi:MAG: alpha/beta hydrolase [Zetaproteobacteria bacterium]|nr:alpha/beta hydrolase [Zetaproteobacteria bacterium]